MLFKNTTNIKHIKYEYSDGKDRVFISYQRESFDFVIMLSDYLEKNGIKTWYAPRNIKLSGLWPDKLHEAIENCKCLLLLYTEQADKSKHVIREVAIADDYNKPVMWLKLDTSEPQSKVLKYFLKLVQTIEFKEDENLLKALCDVLSKDIINFDELKEKIEVKQESKLDIESKPWAKGIYAFDTPDEAADCVARVYYDISQKNDNKTALLPTGRSAKRLFQAMLKIAATEYENCPFGNAYLMNDTETFGVTHTHITSRVKAINDNLIHIMDAMNRAPKKSKLAFWGTTNDSLDAEELATEHLLSHPPSVYGISVSPYMEIIGYDLGTHTDNIIHDSPRVIEITDETKNYIDKKQKSHSIYTIGLGTALKSETLMILAFESNKSTAIERLFKDKIDSSVPITLLRNHTNAYLITTKEIATKADISHLAIMDISPEEAAKCIVQKK